nr:MAG TPA: hypothetical protein [Caudoviricetes sp.]
MILSQALSDSPACNLVTMQNCNTTKIREPLC